ncbi:hypothetical protein PG2083B_0797 [Bifidobacterium pseudolongum subsp. globosum]|uniref:Uncharacterized protein n=1 Tax=Bifidobacterium pseudolongum subsp. globosum TaxID=1690 RepID=A0A2N3QY85_9BIFI|nr:hypothetical protein [Bifidobacterium pseudolongum]PKU98089.1 hypothetical protein CQR56_0451 [Bifidobacterium pseudolongum subsp. globosum]PKV03346.1 hypothetical protein CQR53_0887 [Bifidobacterium pseudolongum subsp. globosum]RYQ18085.1 hypothetical protein PG2083B_0797 [Bifidobacterium pseudolongum subsp. globosum]RYQ46975.1 hypothetical protein PG1780B_0694 [Bifidobacterium pseudolongum subsp. globosum]RYQ74968.1 hypothetical protein PG1678B_0790 [Bifidobacterium pseudolongum subsp. gl
MGISSFIVTIALVATTAVAPAAPADMRSVELGEGGNPSVIIYCPDWAHDLGWC